MHEKSQPTLWQSEIIDKASQKKAQIYVAWGMHNFLRCQV